jgi:hypothetical protein
MLPGPIHLAPGARREKGTFFSHIVHLVGHLAASAAVFVAILTFGWMIGFIISSLNAIHPFPKKTIETLESMEHGLLYLDFLISGCVLLVGGIRFVKKVVKE